MKKLKIAIDQDKCIGNASCMAIDPEHFAVKNAKAHLIGGKMQGNLSILEKSFSKESAKHVIEAAKACPTNAITIFDSQENKAIVDNKINQDNVRKIAARYDDSKEFVLDPAGYFLIRINKEKKDIEVAFCNERNTVVMKVTGKKPIDIYQTIINKEKLDIRKDHAAYLGRELQKAYIALQKNLEYVQDDELKF